MENIQIMKYIATWGWFIIANMFLINAMVILTLPPSYTGTVFVLSFMAMFAFATFKSLKVRK